MDGGGAAELSRYGMGLISHHFVFCFSFQFSDGSSGREADECSADTGADSADSSDEPASVTVLEPTVKPSMVRKKRSLHDVSGRCRRLFHSHKSKRIRKMAMPRARPFLVSTSQSHDLTVKMGLVVGAI